MCYCDDCPGCPELSSTASEKNVTETVVQQSELIDCREKLLRVSADLQNFQRRVERERLDWSLAGQIEVVRALLPVIDDLELALKATGAGQAWVDGLKLVKDKAITSLSSLGVEEIACDSLFDPELHEALATVAIEGKASGQIIEVLRRGYLMKGRVIRHAQVTVAQ